MTHTVGKKTIKKIEKAGVKDVSKFIAEAIKEKLKRLKEKTKPEPKESFDDKLKKFNRQF